MIKKILLLSLMIILSVVSIAGAAPATDNKPIVAILVVNNSGLEDSSYIVDSTINHLTTKLQAQATILTGTELINKLQSQGVSDISNADSDKLTSALKELGVTYLVRAEVNKIEVKRGIKMGLTIKKWCTADVPATITVTDIAKDVSLYNKTIAEKGKNEVTLGFASSGGAVKTALTNLFEQVEIKLN